MEELLLTKEMILPDYRLRFKLARGIHWYWNDKNDAEPKQGQRRQRVLVPELKQWLDKMGFPHRLRGFEHTRAGKNGAPYLWFEDLDHAMMFKLAWFKTG